MSKIMILTEKREAGYDLASTLGDSTLGSNREKLKKISKIKGYLEGEKYVISWAAGHLYREKLPREINEHYSLYKHFENQEDYKMPQLKNEMQSVVSKTPHIKKQIKTIKELLAREDIEEIIIATDADDEGEKIGRDMIYKTTNKLPTTNITRAFNTGSFKSKESVQKALKEREPITSKKYERIRDAQKARSVADYLKGMKFTKVLCDTYNQKLYTGRVKSAVIALIGNREKAIKEFKEKEFYTIEAKIGEVLFKGYTYDEELNDNQELTKVKKTRWFNKETFEKKIAALDKLTATVVEYKKDSLSTKKRPLPLSGTDFASEMMAKYKIKYKQCNEILDYLRDAGFTTYPGTNGRYFSKDDASEVQEAYATASKYFEEEKSKYTTTALLFNDKEASKQNHTPLSITGKLPTSKDLEVWKEEKLSHLQEGYELIAKRIFVHFLPDDEIEKASIAVQVNDDLYFSANGQKAIIQGWRTFLQKEVKNTLFEFDISPGDEITFDEIQTKVGKTKPQVLFTEGTLTEMMLNISKVVSEMIKEETDPEVIKKLKQEKKTLNKVEGIGTDRTREEIIGSLLREELVTETKDGLILSPTGNILYVILPQDIKTPGFTAKWESYFEAIRQGEMNVDDVLVMIDNEIMKFISEIYNNVQTDYVVNRKKAEYEILEDLVCPLCNKANLIDTPTGFLCKDNQYSPVPSEFEKKCTFSIYKNQTKFFGRVLVKEDIYTLISSSKDAPLEGNNNMYLDLNSKYMIGYVWKNEATPGELIETKKVFKLGDLFLFKNVRYKDLTKNEAKALLEGNEVVLSRKSKANKVYKVIAKMIVPNNGIVSLELPKKD